MMMKTLITAASVAGLMLSPAFASDLEAHCEAYTTESGGDPSGCACLADAADADMTAELMAVASDADIEALSDASKGAIAACWPDA